MKFRDEDLAKEKLAMAMTLVELKTEWLKASEDADLLIQRLPLTEVGCLYLDPNLTPVTPNPSDAEFPKLIRHYGSIHGAWPSIARD